VLAAVNLVAVSGPAKALGKLGYCCVEGGKLVSRVSFCTNHVPRFDHGELNLIFGTSLMFVTGYLDVQLLGAACQLLNLVCSVEYVVAESV
jgi:hypothetical protein